jgi:hypothetical protein
MTLPRAGTGSKIYGSYVSVITGRGVIPVLVSRATGVEMRVTVRSSQVQSAVALKEVTVQGKLCAIPRFGLSVAVQYPVVDIRHCQSCPAFINSVAHALYLSSVSTVQIS